jgi:adenylosuccinate lyase
VGIAHSLVALQSALKGVGKLAINPSAIEADLNEAWEVLAEPIQTVLRKAGYLNPYEKLKELTRGQQISAADIRAFVEGLPIEEGDKARLLEMRPETYIGLAAELVDRL